MVGLENHWFRDLQFSPGLPGHSAKFCVPSPEASKYLHHTCPLVENHRSPWRGKGATQVHCEGWVHPLNLGEGFVEGRRGVSLTAVAEPHVFFWASDCLRHLLLPEPVASLSRWLHALWNGLAPRPLGVGPSPISSPRGLSTVAPAFGRKRGATASHFYS